MNSRLLYVFVCIPLCICSTLLFGTPSITSVSPVSGSVAGGNLVTITGSGFTGATVVKFGNKTASVFNVIDDSTIQAIAPVNSPGVNEITVTAVGTSPLNPPTDYYTYQGDWFAYVPNFGSSNVNPINATVLALGTPIPVGSQPNDVVVTPNGKLAIVINSGSNSITLIDVATQTPALTVPVGVSFPILATTPDGTRAALVSYGSNTLTIVDLTTFTTVVIPVGNQPTCVAIVPNGNLAYVTNSGSSSLTQIDLQTFATTTIPGPVGSIPSYIGITPDGMTALVTDDATNSVYIFDPINLTFGSQIFGFAINAGGLFPCIGITPDGTTAWITNTASNTISSIVGLNTPTPAFGTSITVGSGPNGIAITPDGKQAYVSNASTNNESIVTLSSGNTINTLVGGTPTNPGITPDQAPVAYFTATPNVFGQPSTFDASASLSPVGSIASYLWDFGDGSPVVTTNTPITFHTYQQSGFFNVTLTVTNSAGTSVTQNFTGQTMLNNGGPSATSTLAITIEPSPPQNFEGHRCKNKFAVQTEYVDQLSWQPSQDPSVVEYLLFRNGVLIATIPANSPLKFNVHDRCKNRVYTYTLIAVDQSGIQSPPSIITVP